MAETAKRIDPKDSRFFEGHFWCSDQPDCLIGLSMPGVTAIEAAVLFVGRVPYWRKSETKNVYTMSSPTSPIVNHVITL